MCFQEFPSLLYEQISVPSALFPLPPRHLRTSLHRCLLTSADGCSEEGISRYQLIFFSLLFLAEIPSQQLVQNSCRVQALLQPHLLYHWQTVSTIFVRHGGKRGRRSPRAAAAGAEMSKGANSRSVYQANALWGKGNQIFVMNWRMDRYGGKFNIIFYICEVTR